MATGMACAPVRADDADQRFEDVLIEMRASDLDAGAAHRNAIEACQLLSGGYSVDETIDHIGLTGPLNLHDRTAVTTAAILAYCPQNAPVNNQVP